MIRVSRCLVLAALGAAAPILGAQNIPTPDAHLGFRVGADRTLADWPQVVGYFGRLADASPAVKLDTLGETTQGRPFIVATISTPEHIRNIEQLRAVQARLADPRGLSAVDEARLLASQPAVVVIQCNIHSTEVAASQMAMELAHRLATNDTLQRALRDVVVLLIPSANPDGHQMVTEWYRQNLGTQWEGGPMPWLYHHYVGHDNNRDWYMVTQKETRMITDLLYRQWFPLVFYDVHQMGNGGMRMFVPPFVDPINPNIDPLIVRSIAHIGAEMSLALEERGKQGVGHGAIYDLWWHGGARSTPTRHNIVGVLTEAASVRIATPIEQDSSDLRGHARGLPVYERRMNFPHPWPGGAWRLRDIVDYELITSEALVRMLSQQRDQYVRNFVRMGRRAVTLGQSEPPYAYMIPRRDQHDPGAARRLLEVLRVGGVELESTPDAYVVRMAQPYRAHAKDLLEPQRFPHLEQWPGGPPERPYDVAGWTLSQQMGVRVVAVDTPLTARTMPVASLTPPLTTCPSASPQGRYPVLDPRDSDSYRAVFGALRTGIPVRVSSAPVRASGGVTLPAGSFVLERTPTPDAAAVAGTCPALRISSLPAGRTLPRAPRIALYKPWTASMDEGWTRFVLEQFQVPFTSLTDSVARAGRLRDQYDVILVPDMSLRDLRSGMTAAQVPPRFAGGLGTDGVRSMVEFVRAGGTLVLLDASSEFATEELGVGVRLITESRRDPAVDAPRGDARAATEPLYAPGSVLRVLVDASHPIARGMPDTAAVYFTNSVTFDVSSGAPVRVIARYPARGDDILLSGFLQGANGIAGRAAAVEATVGEGRVVMFGFRPQYRGQSYGTFKMLFNALLEGGSSSRR